MLLESWVAYAVPSSARAFSFSPRCVAAMATSVAACSLELCHSCCVRRRACFLMLLDHLLYIPLALLIVHAGMAICHGAPFAGTPCLVSTASSGSSTAPAA
eukprot:GHRQ01024248.1.p4 GENE.GHRQ01024248.1~~GHRQ01024248.1.p4  ORF type:complete len:101 (+),score=5.44 GHRQ01024248.1:168-470(+)